MWRFAHSVRIRASIGSCELESDLSAMEGAPANSQAETLKHVLAEYLGTEVNAGKIIHGDEIDVQHIKLAHLFPEIRKHVRRNRGADIERESP
jgi:hypothetical protein